MNDRKRKIAPRVVSDGVGLPDGWSLVLVWFWSYVAALATMVIVTAGAVTVTSKPISFQTSEVIHANAVSGAVAVAFAMTTFLSIGSARRRRVRTACIKMMIGIGLLAMSDRVINDDWSLLTTGCVIFIVAVAYCGFALQGATPERPADPTAGSIWWWGQTRFGTRSFVMVSVAIAGTLGMTVSPVSGDVINAQLFPTSEIFYGTLTVVLLIATLHAAHSIVRHRPVIVVGLWFGLVAGALTLPWMTNRLPVLQRVAGEIHGRSLMQNAPVLQTVRTLSIIITSVTTVGLLTITHRWQPTVRQVQRNFADDTPDGREVV